MPPASVATILLRRIRSKSDVLPWSTCPMTVTTGARGAKSSGESCSCNWFVSISSTFDGRLMSNSQPISWATKSANVGSKIELMVMLGSAPWSLRRNTKSPQRTPIDSDRDRTVIGEEMGTLPFRGWVGPPLCFCLTLRSRSLVRCGRSSSANRRTRVPWRSASVRSLRSLARSLRC